MGFKVSLNTSAITTNHEVFGSLRLRGCCLCPTCHLPQRCCGSRQDPWGPSCRSCSLCRQRCLRLCPRILQRILRRCLTELTPTTSAMLDTPATTMATSAVWLPTPTVLSSLLMNPLSLLPRPNTLPPTVSPSPPLLPP